MVEPSSWMKSVTFARYATLVASRATGARVRTGWGRAIDSGKRSGYRCYQSGTEGGCREWGISRGPFLSTQRLSDSGTTVARTEERHFNAGRVLRAAICYQSGQNHPIN